MKKQKYEIKEKLIGHYNPIELEEALKVQKYCVDRGYFPNTVTEMMRYYRNEQRIESERYPEHIQERIYQ